ncbi:MAG: UDP-glucose/GDP-mannose dehydrogenase family protein [Candidatus Omnitrophica bacterium]|nr:UDP-glucose/GDP-mannose dehydrogenase family protein [Candidatus Omnitrophota bacterium]
MDICVVGTGYVGLVTGACLADIGNRVICVDVDKEKINKLKKGIIPIYELGLKDLVKRNQKRKRLAFTTDLREGLKKSTIIFIAVGTPPKQDGGADLTYVENVARQISQYMTSYKLIVEKSTVPVETGAWVKHTVSVNNRHKVKFDVASNPEFLREGQAINDFMHPDRIVIGVGSKKAEELLVKLYSPLRAPMVITDIKSAEIIKHASNSFLAMKISFINAISNICEKAGADVEKVAEGMGLDKRIGRAFLDAGVGFGGFCFPKDLAAFIKIAEKLDYNFALLKEVEKINEFQKKLLVNKIKDNLWIVKGKTIGILGLSFKPNTDDIRFAPSLDIIRLLRDEGANIKVFDPQAMNKAREVLKKVKFCKNPYEVARNADCLVIVTEWNEFKKLDLKKIKKLLKQPLIVDGRNIYNPKALKKAGFKYICMGKS